MKLWRWLKQKFCRHTDWRPALTSRGPAKHCDHCGATVQLTREEYYAQFGTIPHFI